MARVENKKFLKKIAEIARKRTVNSDGARQSNTAAFISDNQEEFDEDIKAAKELLYTNKRTFAFISRPAEDGKPGDSFLLKRNAEGYIETLQSIE